MIRGSIDLGTNTCLLLIAECGEEENKKVRVEKVLSDNSTVVRLGEGVDKTRELQPAAIERTLQCLRRYSQICKDFKLHPGQIVCVGTSSSRDAKNGAQFYAQVEKETGFRFRVITGDDEAKYTFLGALAPGIDPKLSAVIDIGGGSTEFIAIQPGSGSAKIIDARSDDSANETAGLSLDMGSVRFTERFFKSDPSTPVTDEEFWACQESIDQMLAPAISWREKNSQIQNLVAVAGTATTLAAWHLELKKFDAAQIDQCCLTRGDIHRMVEELKWRTVAERKALPGIEPGRADVLLAGALILWRSMEILAFPEIQISTRGLRYGILGIPLAR
jgi:exopolyphosphatase/guanosine-5'-triphosphate,3'-diphosphate pyrophosphatase